MKLAEEETLFIMYYSVASWYRWWMVVCIRLSVLLRLIASIFMVVTRSGLSCDMDPTFTELCSKLSPDGKLIVSAMSKQIKKMEENRLKLYKLK